MRKDQKEKLADAIIAHLIELEKLLPNLPRFNHAEVRAIKPDAKEQLVNYLIADYEITVEQVSHFFEKNPIEVQSSLLENYNPRGSQVITNPKLAIEFFNLAAQNNPYPMWELIGANIFLSWGMIGYVMLVLTGVALSTTACELVVAVTVAACLAVALTNIVHAIIDKKNDVTTKQINIRIHAYELFKLNFPEIPKETRVDNSNVSTPTL